MIQVNTAQGSVQVTGIPKRIVTLGSQWIDTALAFGVTPVGYLDQSEVVSGTTAPWVGDRLADSKKIDPENIVAEIAALDPDLILAEKFMAAAQPDNFAKVKDIAPTIPGITGKQIDPWQDQVTLFGTLTRETDKAEKITAGVDGRIEKVKSDLPGLRGKTYSLAFMFSSEEIQVMADPTDGAGVLFASLGLEVAPKLAAEFAENKQPRFPISTENVPMLDADMLAVTASNQALKRQLVRLPGYSSLRAVRSHAVAELSLAEITGLNQPTALSIPHMLDVLRPVLTKVAQ